MLICASCGQENVDEARFCPACGTRLADGAPAREVRKTVTVVFTDVMGSTAIGEQLDPEPLRRLMLRWYEEMKAVCEAHGGRVRGLIGDAVMAAFGVPTVHEDDALRAVRAALAMRERLEVLNDDLERDFGLRLRSRTGINTGAVIVLESDPSGALALGDAVNVAARLESAAEPGEVLIGAATYGLVADGVRAETVEPLSLKGKAQPVAAFRVLEVLPEAEALTRHFELPLVGRRLELAHLRQAFDRAVRERRCHLVTVFGPAGIGKSRLSREFAGSLERDAGVLTGRCLSYGKGITYGPVREIVTLAAGDRSVRELLEGSADADAVAERIEIAIGTGAGEAVKEEIAWAVRRLIETLARQRPLLLVFEDIHWAEPTLLDLIEYLADSVCDVPVLVVCLARPELLDERPAWAGGKLNAASVLLDPLSADESSLLIAALPAGAPLAPERRARITRAAQGNPLFLEQMLAMLAHGGDSGSEIAVPPAIHALLTARLDRLEPADRGVLECASIEGELFHLGAVVALASPENAAAVEGCLRSLVRKELIRAEPGARPGDDAFRFRHALIRDAAYEGLSKAARSELHERYATWLEDRPGGVVAALGGEFLGYHLEQAYVYRAELGPVDGKAMELADRARMQLGSAGGLAFRRGDVRATINLLERAGSLPRSDERAWLEFAPDLGRALFQAAHYERAQIVLSHAIEHASAAGERGIELRAWQAREQLRLFTQLGRVGIPETIRAAETAIAVLEGSGDELALARAWNFLCLVHRCTGAPHGEAAERGLAHARRAGSRIDQAWSLAYLGWSLLDGPTPVHECIGVCHRLRDELANDPLGQATACALLAPLLAMQGMFDDARVLIADSRAARLALGPDIQRDFTEGLSGRVETLAGDFAAGERAARAAAEAAADSANNWATAAALIDLARALCDNGDPASCLKILDESELHPAPPDREIIIKRPTARALALARLGRFEEAEGFAREAVGHADGTQWLLFHADALSVLGEVLRSAGRPAEAAAALEEAVGLFALKGNVVSAGRARAGLEELRVKLDR